MHVADGVAYGAYRYPDILSPEPAYQIPTVLIAFDARSGLERWRYPNEDPFASWLRVTSDERAVYVGSAGDVAALDPQTGRQIWSRSFESGGHVAGLSPSALILSNKEEFQFRGEVWTEQYAEIRGLDPATGQRNWLWMPDGWLEGEVLVGAGRVFTQVDEPVAVDRVNRRLVAINDASGQIVWELSHSLAVPPNPDWFTPATDDPPASTLSWRDWVSLVFTAVWTVIVAVALVRRTRNRNRGPTRIGGRKPTDGLV